MRAAYFHGTVCGDPVRGRVTAWCKPKANETTAFYMCIGTYWLKKAVKMSCIRSGVLPVWRLSEWKRCQVWTQGPGSQYPNRTGFQPRNRNNLSSPLVGNAPRERRLGTKLTIHTGAPPGGTSETGLRPHLSGGLRPWSCRVDFDPRSPPLAPRHKMPHNGRWRRDTDLTRNQTILPR
jgi:hypothetical protein